MHQGDLLLVQPLIQDESLCIGGHGFMINLLGQPPSATVSLSVLFI